MKRVLIVFANLNGGAGIQTALINTLNILPRDGYEYDLLLASRYDSRFSHHWNRIPKWINVLPPLYQLDAYSEPLLAEMRRDGLGWMADIREEIRVRNTRDGVDHERNWNELKKIIPECELQYDIAIAYNEDIALRIVADKVFADVKIGWTHNDYVMAWDKKTMEQKHPIWEKMWGIVCVSRGASESFAHCYPDLRKKLRVIYNPNDRSHIKRLADAYYPSEFVDAKDCVKVFTASTISKVKGTDLIVKSANILIAKGYRIVWYIAGNIGGRTHNGAECVQTIIENDMDRHIVLLGYKENPYPYFKHCDIYVQPSRFESLGIAVQEAKILCKPVLMTNCSGTGELIRDGETGLICDIRPEDIAEKLQILIDDDALRKKLSANLENDARASGDNAGDAIRDMFLTACR